MRGPEGTNVAYLLWLCANFTYVRWTPFTPLVQVNEPMTEVEGTDHSCCKPSVSVSVEDPRRERNTQDAAGNNRIAIFPRQLVSHGVT